MNAVKERASGASHGAVRRFIIFGLVLLFVVQTALTWTTSTQVSAGMGHLDEGARRGRQLYQELNCTACHQFYGLGGYMGPDLTNVISSPDKGADYARGIILHGTQRMPAQPVTGAEADDLVAYLEAFSASGTYPIRALNLTPYGTYQEMIPHADR